MTRRPTLSEIAEAVCAVLGVERRRMLENRRTRDIADARALIAYLGSEFGYPWTQIRDAIGAGSHATAVEASARAIRILFDPSGGFAKIDAREALRGVRENLSKTTEKNPVPASEAEASLADMETLLLDALNRVRVFKAAVRGA